MALVFVEQIRVGKLKTYTYEDEYLQTTSFKSPLLKESVKGRVWVTQTGILGDDGIDEKEKIRDKALFAYPSHHYEYWIEKLNPLPISIGQMGENLVVSGTNEYEVFIGDTFKVGEAIIQVSQPRLPCWRVAYHVGDRQFAEKIKKSGRVGWHFRVLKEGFIKEKAQCELIDRPYPQWSVARCFELLYIDITDLNEIDELTKCHLLTDRWRSLMIERLNGRKINDEKRMYGPMKKLN